MAKRFTDSEKWKDAWFMDLPSKYKLLWTYLLDECDIAGIWKVNFKVAQFYIGEHLEVAEVKRVLSSRVNFIDDEYWHILGFIKYQQNVEINGLNPNNNAHKGIIERLKIRGLLGATEDLARSPSKSNSRSKGNSNSKKFSFLKSLVELGVDENIAKDYLAVRKNKKATNSKTAFDKIAAEIEKSPLTAKEAIKFCAENSWSGFKYSWVLNLNNKESNTTSNGTSTKMRGNILESTKFDR